MKRRAVLRKIAYRIRISLGKHFILKMVEKLNKKAVNSKSIIPRNVGTVKKRDSQLIDTPNQRTQSTIERTESNF